MRVIPAFDRYGRLPRGAHTGDVAEVEQRLVQTFPASTTRSAIYRGWRDRRSLIASIIPIERDWLDGSFAEAKRDPGDADVVTFLDGDAYEALTANERADLDSLFARIVVKVRFGCDGFIVPVRPPGHPLRPLFEAQLVYWRGVWSHDRLGNEKGFVDVVGVP